MLPSILPISIDCSNNIILNIYSTPSHANSQNRRSFFGLHTYRIACLPKVFTQFVHTQDKAPIRGTIKATHIHTTLHTHTQHTDIDNVMCHCLRTAVLLFESRMRLGNTLMRPLFPVLRWKQTTLPTVYKADNK